MLPSFARALLFLGCGFFALYLWTAPAVGPRNDDRVMFAVAARMLAGDCLDARTYTKYGLGQSLLMLPFAALLPEVDGLPVRARGPVLLLAAGSSLFAVLVPLLVGATLRRLGYAPRTALLLAFAAGAGTVVWPYAGTWYADLTLAWLWLLPLCLLCRTRTPAALSMAGAAAGFAVLVKPTAGPALVFFSLYCLRQLRAAHEPYRRFLLFLVPALLGVAATLGFNQLRFGSLFGHGYGTDRFGFDMPPLLGLYGLLLSPGKSIFLYNPVLLLALAGAVPFCRAHRAEALLLAAIACSLLAVSAPWWGWAGDWAWGARYLTPLIPLLLLFAAPWVEAAGRVPRARAALLLVLLLSVAAQVPGLLTDSNIFVGMAVDRWQLRLYDAVSNPVFDELELPHFHPRYSPLLWHLLWAGQWEWRPWWLEDMARGSHAVAAGLAAALLLFALLLLLAVLTVRDYGVSADEWLQRGYGRAILLRFFPALQPLLPPPAAVGEGWPPEDYGNLIYYGGWFDAPVELVSIVLPLPGMVSRHLLTALAGIIGIAGAWRLGMLLHGGAAGFWAALLLAVTPMWYGHSFNNPKDIPFAAATAWALAAIIPLARAFPAVRPRQLLAAGLAIGLAMGIRIGGIFLPGYLLLALLWAGGWRCRVRMLQVLAAVTALAWLVMLLFWPWAWANPPLRPLQALVEAAAFPHIDDFLFAGRLVSSAAVPPSYLPHCFAVQLPEFLLLLAGAAFLMLLRRPAASRGAEPPGGTVALLVTALAVLLPPLAAIVTRATLYNCARHFLFVLPPLAALSAWAFTTTCAALPRRWRLLPALALALLALAQAGQMARLHPYQYIWYNRFVGGVGGAAERYEIDYWWHSYTEAAQLLAGQVGPPPGRAWRVFAAGAEHAGPLFLPDGFVTVNNIGQADFFLSNTHARRDRAVIAPVLVTIVREGATLCVVKDLRRSAGVSAAAGQPVANLPPATPAP